MAATTYDEVMAALRAADEAGNVDDARRLADIADNLLSAQVDVDTSSASPQKTPERTTGESAVRALGRTGRAAATGILSIPTMLAQGASGVFNTLAGTKLDPAGALQRNLTRIGFP